MGYKNLPKRFYELLSIKYEKFLDNKDFNDKEKVELFIVGYCSAALDLEIISYSDYHDCMTYMQDFLNNL